MTEPDDDLKRREEANRERMWPPGERLRAIQRMADWAQSLLPRKRNSKEVCLELQQQKLANCADASSDLRQ